MRRYRCAERVRVAVGQRRVDVRGAREEVDVLVAAGRRIDARAHGLHADRAHAGGDEAAEHRHCRNGLADVGVGGGDEDAAHENGE